MRQLKGVLKLEALGSVVLTDLLFCLKTHVANLARHKAKMVWIQSVAKLQVENQKARNVVPAQAIIRNAVNKGRIK